MEEALRGRLEGRMIGRVASLLRDGGVAVLPTDTIYGFHCVFSREESIERIRMMKGRPKSTGLILLASSMNMVDALVGRWPLGTRAKLESLWPAPLTAILPASRTIPAALRPGDGVAVRIPAMPALLSLIARTGEPIVSTSVNRSGSPPMNRIADISGAFPGLEAYISRKGPGGKVPSTVLDLRSKVPRVLRGGRIAAEAGAAFGID